MRALDEIRLLMPRHLAPVDFRIAHVDAQHLAKLAALVLGRVGLGAAFAALLAQARAEQAPQLTAGVGRTGIGRSSRAKRAGWRCRGSSA